MAVTYFKRYRMEIALANLPDGASQLPSTYRFAPWHESILGFHAKVKWECFRHELDATVFPCLGSREGCHQLMRDIAFRSNFVPEATWLVIDDSEGLSLPVATVQGLRAETFQGAIQNLGVIPSHRGKGLGSALLFKALEGFANVGCQMAHLEVTVQNTAAVRLYQRLGFRRAETVFKVADVAMA
ncbi:MAG: GNAT family N-acetyltransferase [Pirellulales bacterium]